MENAAGAAEKPRETTALPCSPTPDRVLITIIYLRNVSSQKVLSELTGMSRHRLQRLTGRLAIPHAAAIERRRYRQRGADRLPGTRGGIFRQKITDTDPDPGHDPGDRGLEPGVRVGDDQLDATQAAGLQGSQERSPERAVFAVPDIETRGLRGARRRRPRRPRPRPGRSPGGSPGPCSRSRPGTRRERPSGQGPGWVPERCDLGVQAGADPAHLGLGDPAVRAECLDQVIDLAGRGALQALQQRREERSSPQPGDLQVQVSRCRGDRPRPVPVALRWSNPVGLACRHTSGTTPRAGVAAHPRTLACSSFCSPDTGGCDRLDRGPPGELRLLRQANDVRA
jgi:hypothetical protein